MESLQKSLAKSGLVRSRDGQILGGVCSGLAKKFGTDPWAMRLLVFILLVVIPGSPLLLYPIAWVLMPDEEQATRVLGSNPVSYPKPEAQYPQQSQYPQQTQSDKPTEYPQY